MATKGISELSITYQAPNALVPNTNNSRTHSKHQIRQIADSIKTFGFTNPILVNGNNVIIAGHGRVVAAQSIGIESVPTIRIENLSADQIRAYVVADNRLAENAGWDKAILAIELQHLLAIESDFDVTITGFEVPEIDLILQEASDKPDPDDAIDIDAPNQAVTHPGDLWRLGKHRVLCGNALKQEALATLLGNRRAVVAFLDPPYNVPIDGHASGNGSIHHRDFQMASGEMTEAEFVSFLTTSLRLAARYSLPSSVHYVCMDWRHMAELLAASREIYGSFLNLCVWAKDKGGMGSFYRSQHELIFVFRNGTGQHRNNIQLGQFGRNRTNVWDYPGVNTLSKAGDESNLLRLHPTVKPVALVADALLDCSARGDIVLDSFLGSGSTLIAAERVGRVCHGIDIDPLYVDVAIRRWQRHTGDYAVHAVTGKRFDDCAASTVEDSHVR